MTSPDPLPLRTRGVRLRRALRRLRLDAGMSPRAAARALGRAESTIYRWESPTSDHKIDWAVVKAACEIYGADPETTARLVALARETNELRGWWDRFGGPPSSYFETYLGLESEASDMQMWQPSIVPGLFQTEDYARAAMDHGVPAFDADDIDRWVRIRLARQALLDRDPAPVLRVVLHEVVLRQVIGGPQVMRQQLERLLDAAERPNITIQVFPFSAAAQAVVVGGPIVALRFPEPRDPGVVYLESQTGGLYLEDPADVGKYDEVLTRLREAALSTSRSRDLIAASAAEL